MLFERKIVKQKECAAVPDGDVIRVIERVTIDNGRKGKKHWIIQKKRVSIVDRATGKPIGKPIIEEKHLDKMPGFGEAIWDINEGDMRSQIRDSVRKILEEKAAEKDAPEPTEEKEVVDAFHRTLKQANASKSSESKKPVEPKKAVEPQKASTPAPKKESEGRKNLFSAFNSTDDSAPYIWWNE